METSTDICKRKNDEYKKRHAHSVHNRDDEGGDHDLKNQKLRPVNDDKVTTMTALPITVVFDRKTRAL